MKYETFNQNINPSKLGMGAMRLPQAEPGLGKPVDAPKAQALIDTCMERSVNYYDTAYIYHGGKSKAILGQALARYPRKPCYVADKFRLASLKKFVIWPLRPPHFKGRLSFIKKFGGCSRNDIFRLFLHCESAPVP